MEVLILHRRAGNAAEIFSEPDLGGRKETQEGRKKEAGEGMVEKGDRRGE
jgi:hypothetical protein